MNTGAYKYNPGFLSDEDSIRTFVVRDKDLRLIRDVVRDNTSSTPNRHVLIIGPRGSGKSTLVRRLVAEVRTDTGLSQHWYPIVLGEESYSITSPGEFWLEALFHLAEFGTTQDLSDRYKSIQSEKDDATLRELALGALVSYARAKSKKLLLVVENFNTIVEEQMENSHGWHIRHALQNVPEIMLVATATKRFDQTVDKAMFEQFKVHDLKPLTLGEVTKLWGSLSGEMLRLSKSRPIQILTGGSPRLITILAEFALNHSFHNLMSRLTSLIDQYTDYFKSQLDALPSAERKVFVAVLEKWDPCTTRDVAAEARLPVNATSAQLSRLKSRGAVHKRSVDGGPHWEASERLFNLYYLMRRRGAPSSRVHALVKFMKIYYERDQLYERATDLAKECGALDPQKRHDHYTALTEIMTGFDPGKRAQLLKVAPPDFAERFQSSRSGAIGASKSNDKLSPTGQKIIELLDASRIQEALDLLGGNAAAEHEFGMLSASVGAAFGTTGNDLEKGLGLINKALEIDGPSSWYMQLRGLVYGHNGKRVEALADWERAVEMDPNDAWALVGLAHAKESFGQIDAAEELLRTAIKKEKASARTWKALGQFLRRERKDLVGAEAALRKAVELEPENSAYSGPLAELLVEDLSRPDEAVVILREILAREPLSHTAWSWMIRALVRAGKKTKEVDEAYARAIEAVPPAKRGRIRSNYAQYLNTTHRHELAESVLAARTEDTPDSAGAWRELAFHLAITGDEEKEAVEAFEKSLKIDPTNATTWSMFGAFLSEHTKQRKEAERALTKAIDLASSDCTGWKNLGEHQLREGLITEAAESFNRAIKENPKCVCSIDGLADSLARGDGGLSAAARMIEDFIEKVPDSPYPHIALAKYVLLSRQDREGAIEQLVVALKKGAAPFSLCYEIVQALDIDNSNQSIELLSKFVSVSGKDARVRNRLAWTLHQKGVAGSLLKFAIELSRESLVDDGAVWDYRHTLASLLARADLWADCLEQVSWLGDNQDDGTLSLFLELCIEVAQGGRSEELLNVLLKSSKRDELEPLIVALQMNDDDAEPNVAREVLEVARDIRKEIRGGRKRE